MIYNLSLPYIHVSHIANLLHYVTLRSGLAILTSLFLSLAIGSYLIKYLRKIQKIGQPIRDDGPKSHLNKAGTPTMGGLMIISSVVISTLLYADLTNPYIWIVLFVLISFTILGFLDDFAKIRQNSHKGLSGKKKLLIQFIVGLLACIAVQYYANPEISSSIVIPFTKNLLINLSYFYIIFAVFVVVGASNSVNLTDGLDGLAIMPIMIAAASFALISYLAGNIIYSNYLHIPYISSASELTIVCASLIGGGLGFLWYNAQPAEIFMGDTGSLSIGGSLGIISVITKQEIVFGIIGGLFVIEALSVIIQVYYFKLTKGKRIFKMAPIHHHFEQKGWPESKVVIRFWIIAIIFALIGLSSLKLR
jgi:phospho-N-acetylmuramoyl-pentapeptide-transferase